MNFEVRGNTKLIVCIKVEAYENLWVRLFALLID